MPRITVRIERKQDTPLGVPNGKIIYHCGEVGPPYGTWSQGVFRGCPLGRDYSEESSVLDFILRANADGAKLQYKDVQIVVKVDFTNWEKNPRGLQYFPEEVKA